MVALQTTLRSSVLLQGALGLRLTNCTLEETATLPATPQLREPKTFDIPHPTKENQRLRHRCIESPEARLLHEFQVECLEGPNCIDLPAYVAPLNTACRVYVSTFRHFGAAWGEVLGAQLCVTANAPGAYNVLSLGTRNDQAARDEFDEYGVEYEIP